MNNALAAVPQELLTVVGASAAGGAGLWHLVRPLAQPYIDRALGAVPAWIAARARADFAAALKSGRIPAPAARLLKKLEGAVVEWANEELAGGSASDQAAAIVGALSHLPGLGKLVAADPAGAQADVALELAAVKLELAGKKDAPPPAPDEPKIVVLKEGAPAPTP